VCDGEDGAALELLPHRALDHLRGGGKSVSDGSRHVPPLSPGVGGLCLAWSVS
jgi:hypothetical protein